MANIKSQIKRIGQSEKARLRNKSVKSEMKTNILNLNKAITGNDKAAAETQLKKAVKSLDKAAAGNVIHKKNAANKKSLLTKKYNSLVK